MAIKTFKRYEIKYLIGPEQFEDIKAVLSKRMVPDKFCRNTGSYMVYNIYFDTEHDDIIRRSLDKPYYKEKLRMRSYTMPASGADTVFLELKRKIGGIVAKRRAKMTLFDAKSFIENGIAPKPDSYVDGQVLAEIADFLYRHPAKPKVFISYERTAFSQKDHSGLRVSFDRNILTRRDHVDFSCGDYGAELLTDDRVLMEIKCDGHIPLWLCSLLSEMKIYKTNFSKYGTEYQSFLRKKLYAKKPA